jgi:formylglycine-generating enzyme required for sulfatase activity
MPVVMPNDQNNQSLTIAPQRHLALQRPSSLVQRGLAALAIRSLPMIKPVPMPPVLAPLSVFHDRLRDGSNGPAMIAIPAGEFWMGSPESESGRLRDERRHRVKIAQSFAIGQYTVTFEEYDCFCADQGRTKPEDSDWGRGNRPVINVSWLDALDYTEWLSAQTGQNYRLPTEAEWEYAARAGTETAFWWGNDISSDQANYDGNYSYRTVPVDQFQPNPWGLYQVHGNILEWTGSQYDDNYNGAEMLSSNKNTGGLLSVRGGCWGYMSGGLRSALRDWDNPAARFNDTGFRLARSL